MLADASGYIVAFLAIGKSQQFQKNAARWSAIMLILLGIGVIGEVIHHLFIGAEPQGILMIGFALLSLAVNGSVLFMLRSYRTTDKIHLNATWKDTRADVLVNLSVLISGIAIQITGYGMIDLIIGLVIGLYVIKEGFEILGDTN